jgi:hypothetical protein
MPQPLLNLRDIRVVVEGIGGSRGAQRMRRSQGLERGHTGGRICGHRRGDRIVDLAGVVVADWAEQGTFCVGSVTGFVQVVVWGVPACVQGNASS